MQPAIDHIVWNLQRTYNTKRPVVYNTYQAYLKDCTDRLELALSKADKHGYKFGCKLVRGAYQVQERLRAAEMGYLDPIQPNLRATHDAYDACVGRIMDSIAGGSRAQLMIASHNEASILKAAALMHQKDIPPEERSVFFGQLLGMCDHTSLTLGNAGYAVYKYVPYGPVGDVIPYLVRRAQENGDLMAGSYRELELMKQAMLSRSIMAPWAFPALYTVAAAAALLA
jgi:proline dehydrogenase